jgi:regulatory protein
MAKTGKEELLLKAQNTVFRLLKFRLRSEYEIETKLETKKFPASVIKETIRYFKDLGLIDDTQFARMWVSSRLKRPFGTNRVRLELKQKGVDAQTTDTALREATAEYDESGIVAELARARASKYKNIDLQTKKQRVYGYLKRRGFSMSAIMKAIKTL